VTWMKVDDRLHGHPKARAAGLAAMGLWVLAGSYASAYIAKNREGFVPATWIATLPRGNSNANRLVAVGLWTQETVDGDAGFRFKDWLEINPSWEQEQARKEKERARQRRSRSAARAAEAEVEHGDGHGVTPGGSHAMSHGVSHGVSHETPTRPDLVVETFGGGATLGTARVRPPRSCERHDGQADAPPCGACRQARISHENWKPAVQQTFRCVEHSIDHSGVCRSCRADELAEAIPSLKSALDRKE